MTVASMQRQVRGITRGLGNRLSGRGGRGPDQQVRRASYDVDDARAKPWQRVGDGSVGAGLAHREALLQAAGELRRVQWTELPNAAVREVKAEHDALSAELDSYLAAGEAPVGRPAVLRQEIARLRAILERGRQRLQRVDLTVLEALLRRIDFATGRLFPAIETIARDAVCHRNSVVAALRRLKAHGFISWVRRSVKTGNDGEFAPQREQTSNAYFFEHQARMATTTLSRFKQLLVAKLRRLGAKRPPGGHNPEPREISDPELRAVLGRIGASNGFTACSAST